MVAKQQVHLGAVILVAVNGVELARKIRRETTRPIAREECAETSSEHTFIGCHPFHAELGSDRNGFGGNAALGRPHAYRANSENLFVQIQTAENLLASLSIYADVVQLWSGTKERTTTIPSSTAASTIVTG